MSNALISTNPIVAEARLFAKLSMRGKANKIETRTSRIKLAKKLRSVYRLGLKTIVNLLEVFESQVRRDQKSDCVGIPTKKTPCKSNKKLIPLIQFLEKRRSK